MGFGIATNERGRENNACFVVQVILRPSQEKAEGAQCHKPKREQALFVGFVRFALTDNRFAVIRPKMT